MWCGKSGDGLGGSSRKIQLNLRTMEIWILDEREPRRHISDRNIIQTLDYRAMLAFFSITGEVHRISLTPERKVRE